MFCSKCGAQVADGAAFCAKCGNPLKTVAAPTPAPTAAPVSPAVSTVSPVSSVPPIPPIPPAQPVYKTESQPVESGLPPFERTSAALLAFFLGILGIHDFVLGRTTQGIIKIVLWLTGSFLILPLFASSIWVMMDLHALANDTYPAVSKKLVGPTNTANTLYIVYIVFFVLGVVGSLAFLGLIAAGVLAGVDSY